jgi:hypothetical protein
MGAKLGALDEDQVVKTTEEKGPGQDRGSGEVLRSSYNIDAEKDANQDKHMAMAETRALGD